MAPSEIRLGSSWGRRRCRVCGSRHLMLLWAQAAMSLPAGVAPVGGGAGEAEQPRLRWRCRRCRSSMAYHPDASLWQRRRPLASWLFRS